VDLDKILASLAELVGRGHLIYLAERVLLGSIRSGGANLPTAFRQPLGRRFGLIIKHRGSLTLCRPRPAG
jgi:hypothetical protein